MIPDLPSIPLLTAKNPDGVLRAISIGRISTPHQDLDSIEASHEGDLEFLKKLFRGEIELQRFGEQASGWKIDRESIKAAEELIKTREYDVVVMADIGRAYRNPAYQFNLAHMCKDHGTRLICIRDGIDTGIPGWETPLHIAVLLHGMLVPQTRRRVRDKATFLFYRGSMVLRTRFGYVRVSKEQAASGEFGPPGLRIARDDTATQTIRRIRDWIVDGASYEDIARWLNDEGIAPGPYVESGRWTGRVVISLMRSPLLHGLRRFRERLHEIVYSTGEHRRERNDRPEEQHVPELAHLTKEEQEALWAVMDARIDEESRSLESQLKGRSRKRTLFPGQHLRCGICGGYLYWLSPILKCRNSLASRGKACWCNVQVDPKQLIPKLMPLLVAELRKHPDLWTLLIDTAVAEIGRSVNRSARTLQTLNKRIADLKRTCTTLVDRMIELPDSPTLGARLKAAEQELAECEAERDVAGRVQDEVGPELSREDIEDQIDEVVIQLAKSSYDFAAFLRRALPNLVVVPVQALDTPQVRPRVVWTLPAAVPGGEPIVITVDAFEPGLHITHALNCQSLKAERPELTLEQIGSRVDIGKQRVHQALQYAQLMAARGTIDPFIVLTAAPERASRWRARPTPPSPPSGIDNLA